MKIKSFAYIFMALLPMGILMSVAPASANTPGPVRTLPIEASDTLIRHVEYSGLNGNKTGKPRVKPRQVHRDVAQLAIRTDLITMTEIGTTRRARAFTQPGWGLCWTGKDTGILYRKAVFTELWCGDKQVANVRYYSEAGRRWVLPPRVTGALLQRTATGKRVLVTVAHTVSCAFSRSNKGWMPANEFCTNGRRTHNRTYSRRNAYRVPSYKSQMAGWVNWVKQLQEVHHPDAVINTGDFNLDFKQPWVRSYLSSMWAPADHPQISWRTWTRKDYTHLMTSWRGTRHLLLDGDLVSGEGVSLQQGSVAFPEMVSSDHSPVETVINVPSS